MVTRGKAEFLAWMVQTKHGFPSKEQDSARAVTLLDFKAKLPWPSLKQRKFQLNPRKNFFPLRVTEPWPRLPREAVESPSLEIFKTHLDAVLCSLLWVTLLGQGVGLGDPQRSLPTPTMLGFCDSVIWADKETQSDCVDAVPMSGRRQW